MNRKIYYWKLRESEMQLGERTLIMGVINLTPDSFSDGGRFNEPDRAYARALELEEQGADIIDIGAESTRPGSKRISADEEWQRLVPVLKRLRGNLRAPLSLDTYRAEIAERALEYGVEIFNDPSGLTFDPVLAKVAANGNAGLILNHMRGQPETWAKLPPMQDPTGTVTRDLDATVSRARHAGVDRARIVIDPGLGFGKRKEQNAEIIAHLRELAALDLPILVGASRKSFLAQATEADTTFATAGAVAAAVLNGAHIVRVHDVKQMQSVILVADEIAHAAGISRIPAVEERAPAARGHKPQPFEEERARPMRPPLIKPPVKAVEPMEIGAAETGIEEEPKVEEAPKAKPAPKPPGKPIFIPSARPPARVPGKFSADREAARAGFKPPVRRPPADSDRERRPAARRPDSDAPRGRDFRAGRPQKPFRPNDDRPPRREFRSDRPPSDRPPNRPAAAKRSFEPRNGPPRGGPPRSGKPGAGKSGPPKRPFRKRP